MPVLAPSGGAGRSTLSCLLAGALAGTGETVVLDTAARLTSPWPAWTSDRVGGGLAALPPSAPLSRETVRASCMPLRGPVADFEVLTDGREWSAPPLDLPSDPAAWYQLAAIGGWRTAVVDTAYPITHDLLTARCADVPGLTRTWTALPYAVPVLCAAATAEGVQSVQQAVMVMSAEGLPLHRAVAVLVATGDGRLPAVVRAAATMLSGRTAAVVHLPYDAGVRASGLRSGRVHSRTRQAAAQVAAAVLAAAHQSWGDPLPPAPQPAVLRPVSPAVPA
ncbi:hypothetical protein OG429_28995 [Streptomyces sp. NBC_00190]|uniref:hypothetical protein n=1 Tax=unclassified Streptomyces TaxID=2593676 RepID=UPI002E27D0B0|nr:hypothetical protein [Streptomyces sp. NBC_00190]WSZ42965.1 hypothetical protein OG239_31640 [Streptomyces sp. NBC_00868]